ncbi:transglutaminase-like cysteine peptidase [Flaviflagellibacter deserti]|uniref:Transglutaminase-like cysteine peptidase n=1 Tax=Flaviflagellibacter deserti TaxID=2267266 RepID=A0ABV9Z405_9HYPH
MIVRIVFVLIAMTSAAIAQPAKPPQGAQNLCQNYRWACSNGVGGSISSPSAILDAARSVNSDVNHRIKPRSDRGQYGSAERWALPTTSGDCEDYALLKMKVLIDRGVAPERLRLAQVMARDIPSHVVLLVDADDGNEYVLDNLTDGISTRASSRYAYLKVQRKSDRSSWEYGGYR